MVRLTLIARVHDGLPLAEGLDSDKDAEIEQYKNQAKVGWDGLPRPGRCGGWLWDGGTCLVVAPLRGEGMPVGVQGDRWGLGRMAGGGWGSSCCRA